MHFASCALAALAFVFAAGAAPAAELTVSAAASLTDAFTDIGAVFMAAHPQTKVQFNFAGSGALLQQVANGAPVDVLASADEETMNEAERRRLIRTASRADFASNALVVVVAPDATSVPRTLADLAQPSVRRIAIGVPASVPAGRYARAVLDHAGLWRDVEAKTVGAQSVRQALDYVARGEVDAGFVYATDAADVPGRVRVAFTVPTPVPVRYPIAVVAASREPLSAQAFVSYVLSAPAQAILRRHGFRAP